MKNEANEDRQEVGQIRSRVEREQERPREGICSNNTATRGQPRPDKVGPEKPGITALDAIANKASTHPKHRFQNLYRLLNLSSLMRAWSRLNKNASAGIDRVTAQAYGENLWTNLIDLEQRLKDKR